MAGDNAEDQVTGSGFPAPPFAMVEFDPTAPKRPTVQNTDGSSRPMDDDEFAAYQRSQEHTATIRKAVEAQRGSSTIDRALASKQRPPRPTDPNTVFGFDIPMSVDPQRLTTLTGDETELGYVKDAVEFLTNTHGVLTRIDAAYRLSMLDSTITPDARSARIEKEVTTAHDKAFAARGATIEALQKRIDHTNRELNTPLETSAATPRSNELRTVLRTLKSSQVNEAISVALGATEPTAQQKELLASTLGAHALTIGLTEQQQAMHVRVYNEKTSPMLVRRLEILNKALTVVTSIKPESLRDYFEGSMRSLFSRASNISGMSSKANAALSAINAPRQQS